MESLTDLLNPALLKKARQLDALTKILRASLPQACQQHVEVAGIRDQQIILLTDSPVWVSRLRLYTQGILEMLEEYADIKLTGIKIKPSFNKKIVKKEIVRSPRTLNKRSSTLINQTADSISDPELRRALYNLAKNRG